MCEGPSGLVFQLALYALLRAANGVPQLRQRVRNDEVIEYDSLAVMTPVMTVGEGFRQVWCDNAPEFTAFSAAATPKIVAARETSPAPLIVDGEHFICASCLPWLHFTSMTHAEYAVGAAVPALTWGKLQNGVIPVAGRFNHAFVDGLHASRFYALVEEGFNDPERLWLPLTETAPSLLPQRRGSVNVCPELTAREPYSPARRSVRGHYHRSLSAGEYRAGVTPVQNLAIEKLGRRQHADQPSSDSGNHCFIAIKWDYIADPLLRIISYKS